MKLNFLVLGTYKPNKHLINAITSKGHTYEWRNPSHFYLVVSPSLKHKGEIYDGYDKSSEPKLIEWHKYDAVIPRIGSNLNYNANVLAFLTEICNRYSPQTANGLMKAKNKWLTHQILASKGLSTIQSVFADAPAHPRFLIKQASETMPIVLKKISGSNGKQVIKCTDVEQTVDTITTFWNADEELLLQKYINSFGKDYRAIVVGNRVVSVMERVAKDNWKSNISIGGEGKKATLTKEEEELCIKASRALGLEFSGVDLIRDSDGKAYITEINGNMGSQIIEVTGYNHFNDLIEFVEKERFINNLPQGHPDRMRYENQINGKVSGFGMKREIMALSKDKFIM